MKWISQHIWDFISRFRNDVYLESIDDAGEDTDKFLVAKSNGKVSYRTGAEVLSDIGASSEATDLEFSGSTANGVLTYGGAAQIDVESDITVLGSALSLTSASSNLPSITLTNSNTDANASTFSFIKTATGTASDQIGLINFIGDNAANEQMTFASIAGSIRNATDTDEVGMLKLNVTTGGGVTSAMQTGLALEGTYTDDDIDVDIGYGASSVTTIKGTLTMGSTAFVNNSGVIQVAAQPSITSLGTLTGLTVSGDASFTSDSFTITSANADDPIFTLKNTSNDTNDPAQMFFVKDRGAAPAVGTNLGEVRFIGEDSNQNPQEYGGFLCEIDVATDGQESGQFGVWVATHNGSLQYGLQLTGGSATSEVDVAIGQGAASLTTIAGTLTMGSTATLNNSGVLQVAAQTNITSVGALDGGSITSGFGAINNGSSNITTTGAVSGGELQVDDINLNSKTITLTGSTGDTCAIACGTNGATTITTVDTAAAAAHLTFTVDGNIYTESNSVSVETDDFTIHSDTSAHPTVMISNTTGDATGGDLIFHNKRTGTSAAANDYCGNIRFQAPNHDGSDNYVSYATISGRILDPQDTDEAGLLGIFVATSNGLASTSTAGITMYGHATQNTVNLDIGYGDKSNTTVNGNLIANRRKFTTPGNTDGSHDGDVVYFGGEAETLAAGKAVFYNSSGNWELANATDNTQSDGLLGIMLGSDAGVNGVLLRGMVTAYDIAGTPAVGAPVYLRATDGVITTDKPTTSGNIVRCVGYILDATHDQIWFNPDSTYIEI